MSHKPAPTPAELAAVLCVIRDGQGTRDGLVRATALSDRTIRECVRQLVLDGHPIVSSSNGDGYHFANDRSEIEVEAAIFGSRAARELERKAALERHLRPKQAELFGG